MSCFADNPRHWAITSAFLISYGLSAQFMDVAVTSILQVPPIVCTSATVAPRVTVKNNSDVVVTSFSVLYGLPIGLPFIFNWEGSLQMGQTVNVDLPPIGLVAGEYAFSARTSSPNGLQDDDPDNDAWSIPVVVNVPSATGILSVVTDNFGSDVTWQLATEAGTVLYSGGPYADVENGELIQEEFCLTNGCYTFTISDLFEDGICCDNGQGFYILTGSAGEIWIISNGQYGAGEERTFCLNGVAVPELSVRGPEVFPNPTAGPLEITLPKSFERASLRLFDATGRLVMQQPWPDDVLTTRMDLQDLPNGTYLLHVEGSTPVAPVRIIRAQ